ncbi:MAG TPA: hypothetical protein PKD53_05080 [Chloroflexaceae bacterium]|nr:hypothetical protein [Chloroflexaceae bacterium]
MLPRTLLALALVAALLAGCGNRLPPGEGAVPPTPPPGPAEQALAAYGAAVAPPSDRAVVRRALDQVSLALAVAPAGHPLRGDLDAAQGDLVARLAQPAGEGSNERGAAPADEPPGPSAPAGGSPQPMPAPPSPTAGAPPARPRSPEQAISTPSDFAVVTRKSFDGSGVSGQFASCIDVQILGRDGPVGGAVVGINNGDHSYQDQTDPGGYSGRCGLGASTWSVVLFWTPEGGPAQPVATTVYVSGAPEQRAAVVFQRP